MWSPWVKLCGHSVRCHPLDWELADTESEAPFPQWLSGGVWGQHFRFFVAKSTSERVDALVIYTCPFQLQATVTIEMQTFVINHTVVLGAVALRLLC